ncbi:MAG: hypothetical protein J6W64_09465 [Bacilli bacterium]|nr:hypothetical protein [Bacilli bacterium]
MNLTEISDKIQEKLGKEESGKIADDIANILIFEESNNKIIEEKNETIKKLNKDKEMLIQANGNLLLKVPQGKEETKEVEKEEYREFDFRSVFENGKFKR